MDHEEGNEVSMQNVGIVKELYRRGYYQIENSSFSLRDYMEIDADVIFEIQLIKDWYEPGTWALVCKEIINERNNSFWHGQGLRHDVEVLEPVKWIIDWERRAA